MKSETIRKTKILYENTFTICKYFRDPPPFQIRNECTIRIREEPDSSIMIIGTFKNDKYTNFFISPSRFYNIYNEQIERKKECRVVNMSIIPLTENYTVILTDLDNIPCDIMKKVKSYALKDSI